MLLSGQLTQSCLNLSAKHVSGTPGSLILCGLSNTNQGYQAMAHGSFSFPCNYVISFTKMCASFRVTQLNHIECAVGEHDGRNFTCPGTFIGPMHVLCADHYIAKGQHCLDLSNSYKRWYDESLNARVRIGIAQ